MHNNINTLNNMSYVNNSNHNEEHLHVSKVYQNVSIKTIWPKQINPGALGRQYYAHTCVLFL